jgi:hypothetical protein
MWPEDTGKIRKFSGPGTGSMKSPEFPETDHFLAILSDLSMIDRPVVSLDRPLPV